jgi:hypothetical protein
MSCVHALSIHGAGSAATVCSLSNRTYKCVNACGAQAQSGQHALLAAARNGRLDAIQQQLEQVEDMDCLKATDITDKVRAEAHQ